MKLCQETIKAITCGATRILEEEGGLRFWRFTEHQEYLYTLPRPVIGKIKNYRPTSITSAGVRLAFQTDSPSLFLKADVKKGCPRTFFSFDVVVDGNPRVYKALKDQFATVLDELRRIEAGSSVDADLLEIIRMMAAIMDGMKEDSYGN